MGIRICQTSNQKFYVNKHAKVRPTQPLGSIDRKNKHLICEAPKRVSKTDEDLHHSAYFTPYVNSISSSDLDGHKFSGDSDDAGDFGGHFNLQDFASNANSPQFRSPSPYRIKRFSISQQKKLGPFDTEEKSNFDGDSTNKRDHLFDGKKNLMTSGHSVEGISKADDRQRDGTLRFESNGSTKLQQSAQSFGKRRASKPYDTMDEQATYCSKFITERPSKLSYFSACSFHTAENLNGNATTG